MKRSSLLLSSLVFTLASTNFLAAADVASRGSSKSRESREASPESTKSVGLPPTQDDLARLGEHLKSITDASKAKSRSRAASEEKSVPLEEKAASQNAVVIVAGSRTPGRPASPLEDAHVATPKSPTSPRGIIDASILAGPDETVEIHTTPKELTADETIELIMQQIITVEKDRASEKIDTSLLQALITHLAAHPFTAADLETAEALLATIQATDASGNETEASRAEAVVIEKILGKLAVVAVVTASEPTDEAIVVDAPTKKAASTRKQPARKGKRNRN